MCQQRAVAKCRLFQEKLQKGKLMKPANAIMTFFNKGPELNPDLPYLPIKVGEVREFKGACSPEEWEEFARTACQILGETYEPA